jgi:hypothetical protein
MWPWTLLNTPHATAPLLNMAYASMLSFDSQATTKLSPISKKVCITNVTKCIVELQKNPPILQYTILM